MFLNEPVTVPKYIFVLVFHLELHCYSIIT